MQRDPIGLSHKYRGKKPYFLSNYIISNYTKKGDLVLDPFCGSGGLVIDSVFQKRRLIGIDINPSSVFINKNICGGTQYDIVKDIRENKLKPKLDLEKNNIYINKNKLIRTILRSKDGDKIIALKYADGTEVEGNDGFKFKIKKFESNKGFAKALEKNSRLSVKDGALVGDYFTKLTIYCHSFILNELNNFDENIKKFFLVAFTANLANCSKLLPPIKSRGRFAPGAWMTGFYIAPEYLENNVFHYFENRVNKLLKGKKYFEDKVDRYSLGSIQDVIDKKSLYNFSIGNVKKLNIADDSIDIIVTDPPYEGAVPYLEQSVLWNAFMKEKPDFENEIIVSDAKYRGKNKDRFHTEIGEAFQEMNRVLKKNGKLILTYNSIKQESLESLDSELRKAGFSIIDVANVSQKTATPRQINRGNTVKGDLLLICEKKLKAKKYDFGAGLLSRIKNINFINYNQ